MTVPETYHPVLDQGLPSRYRPVWHVGHLVYQAGNPRLKRSSLTGGGFLPLGTRGTRGREAPSWQPLATGLASLTGGGIIPARPNFLTRLFGGTVAPFQ